MACSDIRFSFSRFRFSLLVDQLGHLVDQLTRPRKLLITLTVAAITRPGCIAGTCQPDVLD